MENEKEEGRIPSINNIDDSITKINDEWEQEKEEKLVNLIIQIVVSTTLKEYYETSNKIPTIQSTGAE
ncbi:hypothetical protein ACTJJ0_12510 [Chitinophaga sp. 22321]|uniref:Uncharacterized protein n=1 Tax=Chitinophaga hostae TaxID=2831022 RepID=A0ABS5IWF4_9BACT|nr:hypothetical protein [Chitinophaga hostae]MBS0027281.1 hypothetical protein [Chitinophaga hostae]